VSFSLPATGISSLIGPSGAGKSSLLRCLTSLYDNWQGSILVAGTNTRAWLGGEDDLRRHIGLIAQKPAIFPATDDSPMAAMTWYEAAAYCNWLSGQEGIPEDQWCYVRNRAGKFAAGMRGKQNYLSLRGYRLPSEAEWEYACRAGARTVRYFGQTDELLPAYAWYEGNSSNRTWPVGRLKPNDFGLFDICGNVWDWCHGRSSTYGESGEDAEDVAIVQDSKSVGDSESRVLRGGAFNNLPRTLRLAYRYFVLPGDRGISAGFRVARTYP